MVTNKDIVTLLRDHHLTIASGESYTGGLFAKSITDVPGASMIFNGAVVSYTPAVKAKLLDVSLKTILDFGVISKECAFEMARGARIKMNADIGISFTGNAGPGAEEDKNVGLCYLCIDSNRTTRIYEMHLHGSREEVRNKSVSLAFEKLDNFIRTIY